MKLYYDAAYGLLFICAGLGIGYFDAYFISASNFGFLPILNAPYQMNNEFYFFIVHLIGSISYCGSVFL